MKKTKYYICLLLSMLLLFVTGCGEGQEEDVQQNSENIKSEDSGQQAMPVSTDSQGRYVSEFISLENIENMGDLLFLGDKVYYTSYVYDMTAQAGHDEFWVMDLDTWENSRVELSLEDGKSINNVCVWSEESFVLLISGMDEAGEQTYKLKIIDKNGLTILDQDITDVLTEKAQEAFFWLTAMEADQEGNIYLLRAGINEKLIVLDSQGQELFNISGDGTFQTLCKNSVGQVYVLQGDNMTGANFLQEIDLSKESLGDRYDGIAGAVDSIRCAAVNENEFLISMGDVLYRFDMNTESSEEVLNWINCDINPQRILGFERQEDGRILVFLSGVLSEAAVLSREADSESGEKTVLIYGTMGSIPSMREQIIEFNRSNENYRVEVKEYSNDEAGLVRLNADIVSGNGPDIINLSGVDVNSFIEKGILTDLYPMMDQGDSLSREDFVKSVLSVYERDGKLYGIPLSFSIRTLLGKTSVVGEDMGWSIEEVLSILAAYPEDTELVQFQGKSDILEVLLRAGVENYVDWEKGTCSFDSQEFIQLLELVNRFPDAATAMEPGDNTYLKLKEDRLLLVELQMNSVADYLVDAAIFEEPVTAIGYPTTEGSGTLLHTGRGFGILEQSENKAGAWEFISIFLGEDYQNRLGMGGFPVRESSLQKVFDAAQQENRNFSIGIEMQGFSYTPQPATDEEIARIRSIIDNAQGTIGLDSTICNIIIEEAESYFSGQKTVEDAVKIIQRRAAMYVSENS